MQTFLYLVMFAWIHLNWTFILLYLNFRRNMRYFCQDISNNWDPVFSLFLMELNSKVLKCTSLIQTSALHFGWWGLYFLVCQIGSKGWFTARLTDTPSWNWFTRSSSCQEWKHLYASRNQSSLLPLFFQKRNNFFQREITTYRYLLLSIYRSNVVKGNIFCNLRNTLTQQLFALAIHSW